MHLLLFSITLGAPLVGVEILSAVTAVVGLPVRLVSDTWPSWFGHALPGGSGQAALLSRFFPTALWQFWLICC